MDHVPTTDSMRVNFVLDCGRFVHVKPKFYLARHVTSRHDSTRSTCRASRDEHVERVEPCRSNMADDDQAIIVLACTSLVVFMLSHTQILFVPSNEIN